MTNPLTGDHDGVLQVSGSTLNRLLATMHQNEGTGTTLPTLPHSAYVRVGDDPMRRVDGVQGSARVQVGVPSLELIDGADDRVILRAVLRIRYTPDSGSARGLFSEFLHGVLRAQFRITQALTPRPPGPPVPALTFAVDPDRVSFTTDTQGDVFPPELIAQDAAVTRQIVAMLQTTFRMPAGMPVADAFAHRRLRCLVAPNGTAVSVGLSIGGPAGMGFEQPSGSRVLLAGRDFAVAVGREFITSLVQRQLAGLLLHTTPIAVTATDPVFGTTLFSTVYRARMTSATASWSSGPVPGGGTTGAISISIFGEATTRSVAPNVTFSIDHRIAIAFLPVAPFLQLVPDANPVVGVAVSGSWPGFVKEKVRDMVRPVVSQTYAQNLEGALPAARQQLGTVGIGRDELADELRSLDDQADATFTDAEFGPDGFVLRGDISVAARRSPVVQWSRLRDRTGYGAFLSWYPGGRIDGFDWVWNWFGPPYRRQTDPGRFVVLSSIEMPGLSTTGGPMGTGRAGEASLTTRGTVVDPVTGDEVGQVTGPLSTAFYPNPGLPVVTVDPPLDTVTKIPNPPVLWRLGDGAEVTFVEVGPTAEPGRFSTLIYHGAGERDPVELVDALGSFRKDGAGLLVLALLPDGELVKRGALLSAQLQSSAVPCLVNEDVRGSWAHALGIEPGPGAEAWRLLGPDGALRWSHDGVIDADALAAALQEHVAASAPVELQSAAPEVTIGRRAPHVYLETVTGDVLPLSQLRGHPVRLCFVLAWAESSVATARGVNEQALGGGGEVVVVVLTGADRDTSVQFAAAHAPDVLVVPDPHRALSLEYGVRAWPTTIVIDGSGVVATASTGVGRGDVAVHEEAV